MAVAFSLILGWRLAVVITLALEVNGLGHFWAAKNNNIVIQGNFVPYLGRFGFIRQRADTREANLVIALMGPLFGFVVTSVVFLIFCSTRSNEVGAVAMFLAVLQLFNLLPIDPLDGGRFVNELIIALRPEWYNKVFAADKILAGLIAIALVVLVMSSLITEHDVGFFENAIRALEIGIALSLISSSLNKDRFNASYGGVSGKIDGNKIAIYAASYLLMVATFAVFALATIFNPEVAEAFMGMASI